MRGTVKGLQAGYSVRWFVLRLPYFRDDGLAWLPRRGAISDSRGDHLVALATKRAPWRYLCHIGVTYEGADVWAQSGHFAPSWFATVVDC